MIIICKIDLLNNLIVKQYDKSEERLRLRSCKNVKGLDVCFTKSKVNEIGLNINVNQFQRENKNNGFVKCLFRGKIHVR